MVSEKFSQENQSQMVETTLDLVNILGQEVRTHVPVSFLAATG